MMIASSQVSHVHELRRGEILYRKRGERCTGSFDRGVWSRNEALLVRSDRSRRRVADKTAVDESRGPVYQVPPVRPNSASRSSKRDGALWMVVGGTESQKVSMQFDYC
jgi:hypothetical protein